jgi:hypothetical protein
MYNCRVIAALERIPEGKTFYDAPTEDWKNLVDIDDDYQTASDYGTVKLKPEVYQWLEENIPNRNKVKGWAIGTDDYNSRNKLNFTFFFQSARDAERFIKRWSVIRRPYTKLNYFLNKRYKYNLSTKTLQRISEKSG